MRVEFEEGEITDIVVDSGAEENVCPAQMEVWFGCIAKPTRTSRSMR